MYANIMQEAFQFKKCISDNKPSNNKPYEVLIICCSIKNAQKKIFIRQNFYDFHNISIFIKKFLIFWLILVKM